MLAQAGIQTLRRVSGEKPVFLIVAARKGLDFRPKLVFAQAGAEWRLLMPFNAFFWDRHLSHYFYRKVWIARLTLR